MDLLKTPFMPTVPAAPDGPADTSGTSAATAFSTVFAGVVPTSATKTARTDAVATPTLAETTVATADAVPIAVVADAADRAGDPSDGETLSRLMPAPPPARAAADPDAIPPAGATLRDDATPSVAPHLAEQSAHAPEARGTAATNSLPIVAASAGQASQDGPSGPADSSRAPDTIEAVVSMSPPIAADREDSLAPPIIVVSPAEQAPSAGVTGEALPRRAQGTAIARPAAAGSIDVVAADAARVAPTGPDAPIAPPTRPGTSLVSGAGASVGPPTEIASDASTSATPEHRAPTPIAPVAVAPRRPAAVASNAPATAASTPDMPAAPPATPVTSPASGDEATTTTPITLALDALSAATPAFGAAAPIAPVAQAPAAPPRPTPPTVEAGVTSTAADAAPVKRERLDGATTVAASPIAVQTPSSDAVAAPVIADRALPLAVSTPSAPIADSPVTGRVKAGVARTDAAAEKDITHRPARRRGATDMTGSAPPIAMPAASLDIIPASTNDDAAAAMPSDPLAPAAARALPTAAPSIAPTAIAGTAAPSVPAEPVPPYATIAAIAAAVSQPVQTEVVQPPVAVTRRNAAVPTMQANSATIPAAGLPISADIVPTAAPAAGEHDTGPTKRTDRVRSPEVAVESAVVALPPVSVGQVQAPAPTAMNGDQASGDRSDRALPRSTAAAPVILNHETAASAAPALSALIAVAGQQSAAREVPDRRIADVPDAPAAVPDGASTTVAMLAARNGLAAGTAARKATVAGSEMSMPADASASPAAANAASVPTSAAPDVVAATLDITAMPSAGPLPAATRRDQKAAEPARASRGRLAEATQADAAAPVAAAVPAATAAIAAAPAPTASDMLAAGGADRQVELARHAAWADGIARDIASAGADTGTARFTVAPATLGAVSVEVSRAADGAAVRLVASSEAARTLLDAARPQLVAEARAQGLHIRDTSVDLAGSSGGGSGSGAHRDTGSQQASTLVADQPRATGTTATDSLTTGAYGGAGGGEAGRQAQQHARQPLPPQTDRTAAGRQPTTSATGEEEARRAADGRYA